jgi:hypothetical protein
MQSTHPEKRSARLPTRRSFLPEDNDGSSPGTSRQSSRIDIQSQPQDHALQQFQALMELLSTEVAYLADLYILVSVSILYSFPETQLKFQPR